MPKNKIMTTLSQQIKAARYAYGKKEYKKAVLIYEKLIAEGNQHPNTLSGLALCYLHLGEFEKSENLCQQALEVDQAHYFALQVLSQIYEKNNEKAKAYNCIQKALSNRPKLPEIPKAITNISKCILKIFGLSHAQNEIQEIWNEPEDLEWLEWAEEFKRRFEGSNVTA